MNNALFVCFLHCFEVTPISQRGTLDRCVQCDNATQRQRCHQNSVLTHAMPLALREKREEETPAWARGSLGFSMTNNTAVFNLISSHCVSFPGLRILPVIPFSTHFRQTYTKPIKLLQHLAEDHSWDLPPPSNGLSGHHLCTFTVKKTLY